MKIFYSLLFLIALAGCSCSKEETYTQKELWFMGKKVDPTIELVGITQEDRRILCPNYGPGCVKGTGRRIKVKKVELIAIMFESEKMARQEALRIDQYYARNWVFDDVKGEPILVDFLVKTYQAVDAKKEYETRQKEKE